ncbi:MAG: DUF979 domain-containing protein [Alphaproteobacteria bacterium]|nr:DUF979 domain-containing protein [Alphaproteobacteria bacterium]MBU1513594.1 DUF979 domain-containing protein [Alphaproteobacteria bacterium]MBU2094761.1 DUF979 domain-containing protein [Alphaproteobacteria bacterium]MBU2150170.1 DUF979 domain-containing protein [Alphaproteobacteria bacterium]MBU2309301.1 DUF979 domain-containing protein [Alphaproteobacteria bacterium]
MIKLSAVYILTGVVFTAFAVLSAMDRNNAKRFGNAAFWGLVAVSYLAGDHLGDLGNGVLVMGLAAIAGFGLLGRGQPATTSPAERKALAERFGEKLFIPALTLPVVVAFGVLVLKPMAFGGTPLLDPKQATPISLALAAVIAVAVALILLRQPLISPLQEGRRLMDTVGWAAMLPQMLAALGAIFALAGVGQVIGDLVTTWIPMDARLTAVAVYCLGMAGFTMIMGNAFAAFPVMTAGIGLPILIHKFGGDPAVVASIGMLSGFCGTLMTPLAANFNLVPAALLELPDRYAVIKAQIPTALPLLIANVVLMYVLAFR